MGLPTPYYYLIKHPPGFVANISVNDVTFYRRYSDYHQAPNGPFNHWMVEGVNVVHLVLVQETPKPGMDFKFSMEILRFEDDAPIFQMNFPQLLALHPPEEQALPVTHQTIFRFDEISPRPIWMDAPEADFPPEGNAEQRAVVAALHDAKSRGDLDDFIKLTEIKRTALERFYGPNPEETEAALRATYAPILSEPWEVDPLDFNQLMFERRAGGRVAYVTRKDGGPALFAKHKTDPERTWEPTLYLTQVNGKWRIFL